MSLFTHSGGVSCTIYITPMYPACGITSMSTSDLTFHMYFHGFCTHGVKEPSIKNTSKYLYKPHLYVVYTDFHFLVITPNTIKHKYYLSVIHLFSDTVSNLLPGCHEPSYLGCLTGCAVTGIWIRCRAAKLKLVL